MRGAGACWAAASTAGPLAATTNAAVNTLAAHRAPRSEYAGPTVSRRAARRSSDPPVAASARAGATSRCTSRASSASVYDTRSPPHAPIASSSQLCSRSSRMRAEIHRRRDDRTAASRPPFEGGSPEYLPSRRARARGPGSLRAVRLGSSSPANRKHHDRSQHADDERDDRATGIDTRVGS